MGAPPRRRELLLSIIDELGEANYETLTTEMRERSGEPDIKARTVHRLVERLAQSGVLTTRHTLKPEVISTHIEYKDRILDYDFEARVKVIQEVPVTVTKIHRPAGAHIVLVSRAK